MKTIILAGGFATRLWPLTADRPKPLLPVGGKPIVEYILDRLDEDCPILSTNQQFASQFEEWRRESSHQVELVVEETWGEAEKLGSIGAVAYLIEKLRLQEDLLIIGGDNIFDFHLGDFTSVYRGKPLLALYDIGDPDKVRGKYGAALTEGDKVVGFQEKPEKPRSALVSTACYIYPPAVFPLIEQFLKRGRKGQDAPGYFNRWLLAQGVDLEAFTFREGWFDIGDRSSYIAANLHYLGGDLYLGEGVQIENSTVRRSVILDKAKIEDSVIEDSILGCGAEIVGLELRRAIVGAGTRIRRD